MKHSPAPYQSPTPHQHLPSAAELRRIAVSAAHSAGEPLKTAFRSQMDVESKTSAHDLVTVWDRQTETTLIEHLSLAVPDSRFTGEEGGPHGSGAVEWIIDPIDGTSNFAHGFAMFSISIAAAFDDVVLAGVVYDPINNLTFSADDRAAYLATSDQDQTAQDETAQPESALAETVLHTPQNPATDEDDAEARLSLLTSFPGPQDLTHFGDEALQAFGNLVASYATVRRIVSGALELCHVAAGWTDVVLHTHTSCWDVAAAQLVLRRAGGSYLPYGSRGQKSWDGTAADDAHLAPGYLGLGPGVEAPTAAGVVARFVRPVGAARV